VKADSLLLIIIGAAVITLTGPAVLSILVGALLLVLGVGSLHLNELDRRRDDLTELPAVDVDALEINRDVERRPAPTDPDMVSKALTRRTE
jgi:hypothetical protein